MSSAETTAVMDRDAAGASLDDFGDVLCCDTADSNQRQSKRQSKMLY